MANDPVTVRPRSKIRSYIDQQTDDEDMTQSEVVNELLDVGYEEIRGEPDASTRVRVALETTAMVLSALGLSLVVGSLIVLSAASWEFVVVPSGIVWFMVTAGFVFLIVGAVYAAAVYVDVPDWLARRQAVRADGGE